MKKTLFLISTVLIVVIIFDISRSYAQYGNESSNPSHQGILQEQLDVYYTQKEKQTEEETQAKSISDAIILAEVGIPIASGISVGVLLFSRKRK